MKNGFATKITTFLVFSVLALVGCGKSGGDGGGGQVATVPTYGYVNGSCYNTQNNTPVAYNLCNGLAVQQNQGYYLNNNQCFQTNTNQVVDISLCNQQNGGWNNGLQTGQGAGGPYQWNPYPNGHYPIGYFPTGYPSFPGYGGNYTSQVCAGIYLWMSSGSQRMVTCNGWNCRGYFMYTQTTYRPILCL